MDSQVIVLVLAAFAAGFFFARRKGGGSLQEGMPASQQNAVRMDAGRSKAGSAATSVEITDEFQKALDLMEGSSNMFITGKAGTGKSTLLRHFLKTTKKKNVAVVAPTGIAALNVGGMTIHSFFKFGIGPLLPGGIGRNGYRAVLARRLDTLIIDEISMVRADLFEAANRALCIDRKNNAPFGGVQVILVGDPYQLPPVWVRQGGLPDSTLQQVNRFFFETDAYGDAGFTPFCLTKIFRQDDPAFINALNNVREGKATGADLAFFNARYSPPLPPDMPRLALTNNNVSRINDARLAALPGLAHVYDAAINGNFKVGRVPAPASLCLKVGARIVMLRNDMQGRWVNGTFGQVHALTNAQITVSVPTGIHDVSRETWQEVEYVADPVTGEIKPNVVASFTQYPISLAWALTVHKSQGQTFDEIALDFGNQAAFADGQTYVALSRCRDYNRLFLSRYIDPDDIKVNQRVQTFMSGIN